MILGILIGILLGVIFSPFLKKLWDKVSKDILGK